MPSVNRLLERILVAASSGGATLWGGISGDIADQLDLAEVAKTNDYNDLINKFNPGADISIERVLDAESTDLSQEPSSTGIANSVQLNFGVAQGTGGDPVQLSAAGELTVNNSGLYRIKISGQVGRTGTGGTAEILFAVFVSGVQTGRIIAFKLSSQDDEGYFENDNWLNLPAGAVITFEVMRDAAGVDAGGLIAVIPTDEGAGTWNPAPCASIRVERWMQTP